jgi:hypothetical protein
VFSHFLHISVCKLESGSDLRGRARRKLPFQCSRGNPCADLVIPEKSATVCHARFGGIQNFRISQLADADSDQISFLRSHWSLLFILQISEHKLYLFYVMRLNFDEICETLTCARTTWSLLSTTPGSSSGNTLKEFMKQRRACLFMGLELLLSYYAKMLETDFLHLGCV